jgi:hypothetical protein
MARTFPKSLSNGRPLREQWRDLLVRFHALPSRQRWLAIVVAVIAAWFVLDEYPWSLARRWEAEGDRIERALVRSGARANLVTPDLARAVSIYGPVEPPGRGDEDRIELGNAINEILKKHRVTGSSFDSRAGQRLKDPDTAVFGGAGIERIQAEVKFEVAPEELPKVLAEIEAHPGIEAITALRLQRMQDAAKRIQVQATIEAWVLASRTERRRS